MQHKIIPSTLVITGTPDEDAKDIFEALESLIANSELDWIDPSEAGDLTDAPILGIRDENGNATDERWGYMDYAVSDPLEVLREKGEIRFQAAS
jgi:hypothetical protein